MLFPSSKQTRERAVNTSACAEMQEEATRYVYTLLYCQNKGDGSLLKTTYIFQVSIHHLWNMLIPFNPHYQHHHHRTPAPPPQAVVKTQLFSLRLPRQLLPRPLVLHHSPSASHGKILGVHICGSLMLSVILPNKIHLFFGTAYHPHMHSAHCNSEQATHLRVPHCSSSALPTSP